MQLSLRSYVSCAWRSLALAGGAAPRLFAAMWVAVLAEATLPALQVVALRALTDRLVAGASRTEVFGLILGVAALLGIGSVVGDLRHAVISMVCRNLSAQARSMVGDATAAAPLKEIATGDFSTRARAARDAVNDALVWHPRAVVGTIQGALTVTFLLVALWPISPLAALLLLGSLAVGLPFMSLGAKVENAAYPRLAEQNKFAEYYSDQLVYQRSAAELVALGTGRRVAGLARTRFVTSAAIFRTMMLRVTGLNLLSGFMATVFTTWALWVVATSSDAGPGGVVGGVMALLASAGAMLGFALSIGTLLSGTGPVQQFLDFVDAAPEAPELTEPADVREIRAIDVSYIYPGAEKPALHGCELRLRRGELVGIVGRNGAGKTTLVNCLANLLEPSAGEVLYDGAPVGGLDQGTRLATVSMLSQDFGRFEVTVRDAVALGSPRPTSDEQIWAALRSARLDGFVRSLPDGLGTQLGQQFDGVGLSGGQWQRLALARVYLRDAPIWILDEPTSAVDAATEEEVFQDLAASKARRLTLVVSHRAWTLRAMDRIYVVDDGGIVQAGTYDELVSSEGVFRELFRNQVVHEVGSV